MKKAISFWWNYFWAMTIQNPRSTFSGLFSGVGLASAGALKFVPVTWEKATFAITCVAAICKIILLCLSADPGKQFATYDKGTTVQVVDSHEKPNDPKAKAVKIP